MKIAVLLPNWVGDTCMATPAIRAISQHSKVQELLVIGRRAPLQVMEGMPFASEFIEYKPCSKTPGIPGRRELAIGLRKRKLDGIVLFPNSLSSAIIAFMARIPNRIGYSRNGRGFLLSHRIPLVSPRPGLEGRPVLWKEQPLIEYYANLARHFGCESVDSTIQIAKVPEHLTLARQFLLRSGLNPDCPTVLLNNGSATSPSRLWSDDYFVTIATELAQTGIQVVVHSGPSDRMAANQIANASAHRLVRSMGVLDQLPLSLTMGLLQLVSLVVTTDSGVRHLASALGRKVIVLYGPTSTVLTRTYRTQETAISAGLPCQPCSQSTCPLKHNRCMTDIKPDRVLNAIRQQLGLANFFAA